jgi:hypothetical protein
MPTTSAHRRLRHHLLFAIAYAIVALIVVFARPAAHPPAGDVHPTVTAGTPAGVPVAGR